MFRLQPRPRQRRFKAQAYPVRRSRGKVSINSHYQGNQSRFEATGLKLDSLVALISQTLGRTVIDKTGLTGLYDLTLTWTSDPTVDSPASADNSSSSPTIFTALGEQLGLKLESAKGPVKSSSSTTSKSLRRISR